MAVKYGTVKQVLSGDTLLLVGVPRGKCLMIVKRL